MDRLMWRRPVRLGSKGRRDGRRLFSIASALNSGENDRRRRFFPMTHSYRTFRAVRSVYETRGSPRHLPAVYATEHGPGATGRLGSLVVA